MFEGLFLIAMLVAIFAIFIAWRCTRIAFNEQKVNREYREALLKIRSHTKGYTEYYGEVSFAMADILKIANNALEDKSC